MNMPDQVREWFIDDSGDWIRGLEHGRTAYDLLEDFNLPKTGKTQ